MTKKTCNWNCEYARFMVHSEARVDWTGGEGEVLLPTTCVGLLPHSREVDGEGLVHQVLDLQQGLPHHVQLIPSLLIISSILGKLLFQYN